MADKLRHASGGAVVDTVGTNSERERAIARLAFDQHGVVALSTADRTRIRSTSGRATGPGRAPTQDSPGGLRRGPQATQPAQLLVGRRLGLRRPGASKPSKRRRILGTCQAAFVSNRRHRTRWMARPAAARGHLDPSRQASPRGPGRTGGDPGHQRRSHAVRLRRSRRLRAAGASLGGGGPAQAAAAGRGRTGLRARLRPARLETDQAPARRSPRRHPDPLPARGSLPELRPLLRAAAAQHQRRRPRQRGRRALARRQADRRARQLGIPQPPCRLPARPSPRHAPPRRPLPRPSASPTNVSTTKPPPLAAETRGRLLDKVDRIDPTG